MVSSRARERVGQVVVAVNLRERERIGPDGEAVEEEAFDSCLRRKAVNDTLTASLDALVGEADADASSGLPDFVVGA